MTSEVFNMDCMDGMKQYPDKYFDLAIVDPPYGIGMAKGIEVGKWKRKIHITKEWDNSIPKKEYFDELFRVSKNQIIWGGNYFIEYLKNTSCFIFWDKKNGTNFMSDGELAWTSFNSSVKRYAYNHIQDFNKGIDRIHPTQKPIDLYTFCLKNYATCKECDGSGEVASLSIDCDVQTCKSCNGNVPKILDTHLGSGSSRIACDKAGYDFVGFELDKDYFEAQEKRFKQYKSQLTLF